METDPEQNIEKRIHKIIDRAIWIVIGIGVCLVGYGLFRGFTIILSI